MPGAFVRIVHDLRQPCVQRTPLGGRRLGIDDGRKQRMGERDAVARDLQDSRTGRPVEPGCSLVSDRRSYEAGGRPRKRRHDEHDLARLVGKACEPPAKQLVQGRGERERVPRGNRHIPFDKGPTELEREVRVAVRGPLQLGERRAEELVIEARLKELVEVIHAERAEPQSGDAARVERGFEPQGISVRASGSPREEEPDRLSAEAPGGERERIGRRCVEPLNVVDRDDELALLRKPAQDSEQSERDGSTEECAPVRLAPEERHLERLALRLGKAGQHRLGHVLKQVAEGGEGQRDLGLDGSAAQDELSALLGQGHRLPPQRRLPDPDRAVEEQRNRSRWDVAEKRAKRLKLRVPPHDLRARRHARRASRCRRQMSSVTKKPPCGGFVDGSDGTRTRDLRRDRPAF
jgi:hypothetical protein